MKKLAKMMMILLGLCSIAGLVACGITVLVLAGWLDAGARHQQAALQAAMTYGIMTMAFTGLALWLNQSLKGM